VAACGFPDAAEVISGARVAAPVEPDRPDGPVDRRRLWWRWLRASFLGETLGFLVPMLVVTLGAGSWPAVLRYLALVIAGAGEGAVLGAAQSTVLRRVVPGFSRAAWTIRTALAAALAWAIGLAPSELAGTWQEWPPGVQMAVAVPAGLTLLATIGTAQWTVLRRSVPGASRWIGWTALAWLAGLTVFLAVATPLWQPGQPLWLVAAIGVLAGALMAVTMAAVTGRGLVRLLTTVPVATGRPVVRQPDSGPAAWARPAAEVAAALGVDPAVGLTDEAAAQRLAAEGPNEVQGRRPVPLGRSILQQLSDTLILVLVGAALLTAATGDWVDCAVIAFVIVVNTTLGVVQERRALRAVAALGTLVAPSARVRRGGRDRWVPTRELVRGDVLRLEAGDVVGADARLLSSSRLQVDESLLTGEALPTDREAADVSPADGPLADRRGMVHGGSTVVRGTAEAVVVGTGPHSAVGRLATLVHERRSPLTPLQRRLAQLGRQISVGVALACLVFLAVGLLRGQPWEITVVAAVALAVAAVPEALPAVVTLALAGGASRMSARGAVVRSLPAVETLGSVTLLATDKTGTLTQGAMVTDRVWTPADGDVPLSGDLPGGVRAVLEAAALCNDADPSGAGAAGSAGSADTETSLVRAARVAGIDVSALRAANPRVREEPFDAVTRRMTTEHRGPDGTATVVVKGAPEAVLPGVPGEAPALAAAQRWAAQGRRVLAVVRDGRLLGLLSLDDPIRPEAVAAIAACHRAGIRTVLVTGDHAGTAVAVARAVGLVDDQHPVEDSVLARVEPEGKLRHVTAWQAEGHVVAMTGDGVNDAPALRGADIGVAMGQRGTEVAKEAADLVLADDSLATVTAAVAEGRRVFDNVRRFVGYGLTGGAAEVLVMLLGPILGMALPLLPAQVLWVNLLTHGPVGVAMGSEPEAPDVLRRPPRTPSSGVFDRALARRVALLALGLTAACLAVAGWSRAAGGPWQTQLFVTLSAGQLALALALRPAGAWTRGAGRSARWLPAAVVGSAVLLAAGVYLPGLRNLLGTQSLEAAQFLVAIGAALVPAALFLLLRRHP
jgi:Ca2+-transporting ATPase